MFLFFIRLILSATTTQVSDLYVNQVNGSNAYSWFPTPDTPTPADFNFSIVKCVFESISITRSGVYGGVIISTVGRMAYNFSVLNSTFTGITVTGRDAYGGAIYCKGTSTTTTTPTKLNVLYNNFTRCNAAIYGSCVYAQSLTLVTVSYNTFNDTTANYGAAAFIKNINTTASFNNWGALTSNQGYIYYQNNPDVTGSFLLISYSCFLQKLILTYSATWSENSQKPTIQLNANTIYADATIDDVVTQVASNAQPAVADIKYGQTACYRIISEPTPTPTPPEDLTPEPTDVDWTPYPTLTTNNVTVFTPTATEKNNAVVTSATQKKSKAGLIAGCVIAALIVLIAIIILIVFLLKRDTRTAYNNDGDDAGVDGFAVH